MCSIVLAHLTEYPMAMKRSIQQKIKHVFGWRVSPHVLFFIYLFPTVCDSFVSPGAAFCRLSSFGFPPWSFTLSLSFSFSLSVSLSLFVSLCLSLSLSPSLSPLVYFCPCIHMYSLLLWTLFSLSSNVTRTCISM